MPHYSSFSGLPVLDLSWAIDAEKTSLLEQLRDVLYNIHVGVLYIIKHGDQPESVPWLKHVYIKLASTKD